MLYHKTVPRIKDLGMKHVWRFLEHREGWSYRRGGVLDASYLYFHKDRPREVFPNQAEVKGCFVWPGHA